VEADPARIRQVVANLVSNAGKFTEQGTITVTVDRAGDQAMVQVKDTGIGIDPEILPRLFTKFAAKSDRGMRLGLYICKRIIDTHARRQDCRGQQRRRKGRDVCVYPADGAVNYIVLPAPHIAK
jgi:signal transduction histidine kinase